MKRNLAALLILGIFCFLSCGERETKLFNGKNLDGWTFHLAPDSDVPAAEVFGVKDGVITIAGQPFGYMITEQSFRDYKLHVEWRWVAEPSNSGIFLHAEPIDAVWPRCAEVNLMNEAHFDRSEGPVALQSEGGPLEIRNIYVTALGK